MTSSFYRRIGLLLLFASLTVGLAAADASDDEQEKGKGKDKGKGKGATNIVQVDLNKLHPGIAQYILDHIDGKGTKGAKGKDDKKGPGKGDEKKKDKKGDGKKGGKEITLVEAINIASRTGTVLKAERKGDAAEATFKIEVLGSDGAKTKLSMDAFGRTLQDLPKKGDEKGKAKGKGKGE
jgi:hypothetical protein